MINEPANFCDEAHVHHIISTLEEENKLLRETLEYVLGSVNDLIADSTGVTGLHLNGDFAPWEELMEGGRYEDWLLSLSTAQDFLKELNVPQQTAGDTE